MEEMHALQDKHEEVASLKKKLQWFTENQALLDRDTGRLKAATAEIQQLKQQVGDSELPFQPYLMKKCFYLYIYNFY